VCADDVATHVAWTTGVRFVVDSGFVKLPIYDVTTGFESLVVSPVSKASATQRAGRAGQSGWPVELIGGGML
jgi:HrpA-like RNA helicase